LLALSGTTFAQTTGNIRGEVTDETGGVLPGAAVTITSEALIGGPRTVFTNEIGVFRFPSIAVGTYVVEITMDGFNSYRVEGVEVTLNGTTTVNAALPLATVAETVTVSGEPPILDVTDSGQSDGWRGELIEDLPTNRNFWDLMQASPGIATLSPDGQAQRLQAYGSGNTSNSWNVDGIEVTSPDTGTAWWYLNPDMIEEIEISGIGAPAEFGNATGAVLNVVTKGGSNDFHGSADFYFQFDELTDDNVKVDPFTGAPDPEGIPFRRDSYRDITGSFGGPISRDSLWFFFGAQHGRDYYTLPGVTSEVNAGAAYDRFDFKLSAQLGEKHKLDGLVHQEIFETDEAVTAFLTPDAAGRESGTNPAWKVGLTSVLSDTTLLELNYAGWWGDAPWESVTGSRGEAFIDYDPPGGGPERYSNGIWYPYEYDNSTHQFSAKMTKYAEDFLKSQHDFKFGVQLSYGETDTRVNLSPTGAYVYNAGTYTYYYGGYAYEYNYLYRAVQDGYSYGSTGNNLGVFLDDSITIGDRLTLNLGVRYDRNVGNLSPSERLNPDFSPTGVSTPGADGLIEWNNVSPRLGFSWQPTASGNTVVSGFFGVFYNQNVMGDWNGQIDRPPIDYYESSNPTEVLARLRAGEQVPPEAFDIFSSTFEFSENVLNYDVKAPRTLQYTVGYEQQLATDVSLGVRYIYKDSDHFIGWNVQGGLYEPFEYTDPFTGNTFTLLKEVERPIIQKGNGPDLSPNIVQILGEQPRYQTDYHGVLLTVDKRFSNGWGLFGSYTWSKTEGLIPDPLREEGGSDPFYSSTRGSDPNTFVNSRGRLVWDRPHMFRLAGTFHLPADFMLAASLNIQSGRAFSRQVRLFDLSSAGGGVPVIMETAGSRDGLRHPTNKSVDLRIGKRFPLGETTAIKLDAIALNLLNDDASIEMATLELDEGDDFVPDNWVFPRRLMILVGFQF
jgi:hypothetical protein